MRFITQTDVLNELSITRNTLWRLRQSGEFIREYRFGTRKVAFLRADFENWLEGRVAR